MESHDEERLMFKALQFGSSFGGYNIRNLNTALKRMELTAAFGQLIPGPKMIWQFGELGYDFSINHCPDGSVNPNCRTANKPIRWDYNNVTERKNLYTVYSKLNQLRMHPLYKNNFTSNRIIHSLGGAFKWMQLTTDTSNIVVVGNFDLTASQATVSFPGGGTWYDYFTGATYNPNAAGQNILLQPGEYKVYVNRNITGSGGSGGGGSGGGGGGGGSTPVTTLSVKFLPNLVSRTAGTTAQLELQLPLAGAVQAQLYNLAGQRVMQLHSGQLAEGIHRLDVSAKLATLGAGMYVAQVVTPSGTQTIKLIIQ
ncbi:MAG: T9SS C-terminal target domain-containing protein [Chitinophagia bacterium]|nr:T9SS C-terminal target domain-containing protein [Chitinophagia bacterium]